MLRLQCRTRDKSVPEKTQEELEIAEVNEIHSKTQSRAGETGVVLSWISQLLLDKEPRTRHTKC